MLARSRRNLSITMSGRPSGRSSIDREYGSSDSEDSIPGSPALFPMGSEVSIVGLQWDGVWGCWQVSALVGMQCSYCIFLGEY